MSILLDNYLTTVANAIRTKKGTTAEIPAMNFANEILALSGVGTLQEKTVSLTSTGTTTISPDTGYSGMSKVSVTPQLQSKSSTITTNTTTTIKPDSGYAGLSQVSVVTNVGSSGATTGFLAFSQTQAYNEGSLSRTFTFPANVKTGILAIQVHQANAGSPNDAIISGTGISASKIAKTTYNQNYNGALSVFTTNYVYKLTHSSTTSAVTVTVSVAASEPRALFGQFAY